MTGRSLRTQSINCRPHSQTPALSLAARATGASRVCSRRTPRMPHLRATNNLALKIFDFVAFLQSDRMMLLDSDILFFAKPEGLLAVLENGHAQLAQSGLALRLQHRRGCETGFRASAADQFRSGADPS